MTGTAALILIVDDDYDFLEINRHILERAGYRVVTAGDPEQALAMLENECPDLIITDLMMTAVDSGFAFSRVLKADSRWAGIPVIISTSVSSALGMDFRPRQDGDLEAMNVDAYFDKPLKPEALLAKIDELLARGEGRPARDAT